MQVVDAAEAGKPRHIRQRQIRVPEDLGKRYGLGRELETVDAETGNTVTAYSIDDPAAQRLAAEEYVARMAAAGVKPSWWREFIQKIRMALARLPGFREVRMTDRQIEILLARSARAMRRNVRTAAGTGGPAHGGRRRQQSG